jgi:branched-chain amino acid transport system ATP-binding protein
MVALILRIRDERKVSIIMTEHVMAAVMRLCEHVAVLDAGKLIASGAPKEIVQNPEVIAAYLGKKHER